MSKKPFFGRREELELMNRLLDKKTASLMVVRGRRRIGKSRLLEEFGKEMKAYTFSGLAPTKKMKKQNQLDAFAIQMAEQFEMPLVTAADWLGMFSLLAERTRTGRVLIVLDEISWMGSKDSNFLGKLKHAWDTQFSQNPHLVLALCGSVSTWIEKNILSHTGFLGRISLDLALSELPLSDCVRFWEERRDRVSSYEIFQVLSVVGGIPKYLEEIVPKLSAEENIRSLCFTPGGLLFREFEQIFSDLFSQRSLQYGRIVQTLSEQPLTQNEICENLKIERGGKISRYLHHLATSGFVAVDPTWNLTRSKISNLRRFRLKDNYLRFYLKYIQPNRERIEKNLFKGSSLTHLPGWSSIMGFQFENLVVNNMHQLFPLLQIAAGDVIMAGPYFQRASKSRRGCQIDLLIQTRRSLYLCEIKFSLEEMGTTIIDEVKEKIKRLHKPKGYSIRPVLIVVNGVSKNVSAADFFDYIIDFSQLIQPNG